MAPTELTEPKRFQVAEIIRASALDHDAVADQLAVLENAFGYCRRRRRLARSGRQPRVAVEVGDMGGAELGYAYPERLRLGPPSFVVPVSRS